MDKLIDRFGRKITYLRLSVTDRCNLRCRYCMPARTQMIPREEILRYEEIYRLARVAVSCGINKLRITGGEPLIRKNITELVGWLAELKGVADLGLTTNGAHLAAKAKELYLAGLRRINISLDTLDEAKYRWITQGADLPAVWSGIDKALKTGFSPVKLNVVAIRGFNDDELVSLARLTLELPIEVRFIEFMPLNNRHFWGQERYISSEKMQEEICAHEELIPYSDEGKTEIAKSYRLNSGLGRVSFISPLSNDFCASCNRLRLTADGYLRSCLFSHNEHDIKTQLRQGVSENKLISCFKQAVAQKPSGHKLNSQLYKTTNRYMHAIGG